MSGACSTPLHYLLGWAPVIVRYQESRPPACHTEWQVCHCQVLHHQKTHKAVAALQRPVMKQNVSSSDSFGSIDEELLKELKKVPAVLATQDELDVVEIVKGLQHRLKVQPPTVMLCLREYLCPL